MATVKKAQNGALQDYLAKRKASSTNTTKKYNREDALKGMNAISKGFDGAKDQASRDSISKAYEPTRDAGMKTMGYSKSKTKEYKSGGKLDKAKSGKSFGMLSVKAGIDKNPNPTAADRIAGAKKMAKSGKKLKSGGTVSAQLGSYKGVIGKNTKGKVTKAVGLVKAKMGKSMGKCKNGC
jgi:hypothetical protein